MATYKQYKKKNGDKAWMVSAYLGVDYVTGKQINITRRGFATKKEAQLKLNQLVLEYEANGNNKPTVTTFEEMYLLWFEVYKTTVKEATWMTTEARVNKYIMPTFGKLMLERIDLKTAQKAVNKWAAKFGMYTKLLTYVRMICDHAVALEIIESNPFRKVTIPKRIASQKEVAPKYYTRDELDLFLGTCDKQLANASANNVVQYFYAQLDCALFRLMAYSGARVGEILALTYDDIDFVRKRLTINKTLSKVKSGYVVSDPKTKSSIRVISLDDKTLHTLKKWQIRQRELLLLNGVTKNSLVFANRDGRMLYRTDVYQRSKRIAAKAKLPNIGNHGFRHTHATQLFEAGVPTKAIQARLGHASISITMDVYTHITRDNEQDTINQLMRHLGN